MKTIFLIGGTMGIGKSTVSKALANKLNSSIYIESDKGWEGIPLF